MFSYRPFQDYDTDFPTSGLVLTLQQALRDYNQAGDPAKLDAAARKADERATEARGSVERFADSIKHCDNNAKAADDEAKAKRHASRLATQYAAEQAARAINGVANGADAAPSDVALQLLIDRAALSNADAEQAQLASKTADFRASKAASEAILAAQRASSTAGIAADMRAAADRAAKDATAAQRVAGEYSAAAKNARAVHARVGQLIAEGREGFAKNQPSHLTASFLTTFGRLEAAVAARESQQSNEASNNGPAPRRP
jgi:hypothetical protein